MAERISPEIICEAVRGSLNADDATRKAAETFFKNASRTKGFLNSLMEVVSHNEIEPAVRVGAAVALKNEIRFFWERTEQLAICYSAEEKRQIRDVIYLSIHSNRNCQPVLDTLYECFRLIALEDYPNNWSGILTEISRNIVNRSDSQTQLLPALVCLRKLAKKYEFKAYDDNGLNPIIDMTFLHLHSLAVDLLNVGMGNSEGMLLLKYICKIYWSTTMISLGISRTVIDGLNDWMSLFAQIVAAPVPMEIIPSDSDDRRRLPQFKCKTRTLQIIHSYIVRYVTKKTAPNDESHKQLRAKFLLLWPERFAQTLLGILRMTVEGTTWVTEDMKCLLIKFFASAVESASLYKTHIKAHGEFLLFQVCFPELCYGPEDEEQWQTNPIEVVFIDNDFHSLYSNPREAAGTFVRTMTRLRGKDFLLPVMNFVQSICLKHRLNCTLATPEQLIQLNREKSGALLMLSEIADRMTSKKREVPIEAFLRDFVLPDLTSECAFLRLRSIWTYSCYAGRIATWGDEEVLLKAFHVVLQLTGDVETPVRMQAIVALRSFIECNAAVVDQAITKNMADILKLILTLMRDMDNECLVKTLECLVTHYENEIVPYAREIMESLLLCLRGMLERMEDANCDELVVASLTVTDIIKTVLQATDETPQIFEQIVESVCMVIDCLYQEDYFDYIDSALEMLAEVTYRLNVIPPQLWQLYERMYTSVCGSVECSSSSSSIGDREAVIEEGGGGNSWAVNMVSSMVGPICNFLSRDFVTFAFGNNHKGQSYKSMLLQMALQVLRTDDEQRYGFRLLQVMFEVAVKSNGIDDTIPDCVQILVIRGVWLTKCAAADMQDMLHLLSSMVFYNTEVFLLLLEQRNEIDKFIDFILLNADYVKSIPAKKSLILALSQLLRVAVLLGAKCPLSLQERSENVVRELGKQTLVIRQKREKAARAKGSSNGDSSNSDSEQELDDDDDAESEWAKSKTWNTLSSTPVGSGGCDGTCDEEDDDDDSDYDDDAGSESDDLCRQVDPLEGCDECQVLAAILLELPDVWKQQVGNWLGSEEFRILTEVCCRPSADN